VKKGLFLLVAVAAAVAGARERRRWWRVVAGRSWWQGGNGGKLTVTVATLAIGGKERAQLQVLSEGQMTIGNRSIAPRRPRYPLSGHGDRKFAKMARFGQLFERHFHEFLRMCAGRGWLLFS
jgi:hypothetical protein